MAKNIKKSGDKLTSIAVETLKDPNASKIQKMLAGSVLSQANTDKQTGADMERIASDVMKSSLYSEKTKSLAASVLAQSNKKRKSKKQ